MSSSARSLPRRCPRSGQVRTGSRFAGIPERVQLLDPASHLRSIGIHALAASLQLPDEGGSNVLKGDASCGSSAHRRGALDG